MLTTLLAAVALTAASDEPFLQSVVQLTSEAEFSRAGEAYFSPDSRWIIFQAVPADEETGGQPKYSMYVAPLVRDAEGNVTGMGDSIRVSEPGSANTCGWFHPSAPGVVLFGSTTTPPSAEVDAGYSRDTSRYAWDFPNEMEVVTRTVREIVERDVKTDWLRSELLSRHDLEKAWPMWTRPGYDAEGSWSPDGRFVLYTAVDPDTGDGDLYVRDLVNAVSHPLVVEPGYDGGPFFSPDGRWICYRSDRKGDNLLQVFVAELAFDERGVPSGIEREIQLTDNGHVNWAPFWHPSGEYLVYATSEVSHMNYEVFAIAAQLEADGSLPTPVRVTSADGFDGLPVFSPDGSLMMWTGQRGIADATGKRRSQLYVAKLDGTYPPGLRTVGAVGTLTVDAAPVADALALVDTDARRFHDHVTTLASPWLSGRYPGTRGIEVAEEYIRHWLVEADLCPAFNHDTDDASYYQPFEIRAHGSDDVISARNVGALLHGKGTLRDRHIVIGAHHDHLGLGTHGSMTGAGEIHEGADDNASGTAAVLMLAERLAAAYADLPEDANARSIVFVTFSAEEMGLNGSREFVRNSPIDLETCDLMINFDMIGRITGGRVSVSGLGSGAGLASIVEAAVTATPLDIVRPDGLSSRSDHAPFYDVQVPVAFVSIDPFHADYHTPRDEAWKLNCHGAAQAVRFVDDMTRAVAMHAGTISFTEVAAYDRGPSPSMGKVKVRFGIMPGNYNDAKPGIVVQRVSPGGSAEAGGILAEDRLMKWNGQEITTVTRWMELMAENEPGDVVTVTVLRGGAMVDVEVKLQPAGG